jgi:hypothetical protein
MTLPIMSALELDGRAGGWAQISRFWPQCQPVGGGVSGSGRSPRHPAD